jgi:uncharacterized membrane protein
MKSLLQSKTFWLAVIQAVIGIVVIFSSAYPAVGGLIVTKSILDVILRVVTNTAVTVA